MDYYSKCKKNYPKYFSDTTYQRNDLYLVYRMHDGRYVALDSNKYVMIDNGWVIQCIPWLL